jgi:hypothetical protein
MLNFPLFKIVDNQIFTLRIKSAKGGGVTFMQEIIPFFHDLAPNLIYHDISFHQCASKGLEPNICALKNAPI